ncbi:MAG: hypothetical protein A2297_09655 [Elusimicrobia bacterium RIFOXYB2_FULL_48_7]|nr:MAG: hypothetical protein A2297_09655 [Elusimicrobia bacterium RIFOXYB2_FULL_48_7]
MNLPSKIGLISGRGNFPLLIAQQIRKNFPGTLIYTAGFRKETNNYVRKYSEEFRVFDFGALGSAIDYFKSRGIEKSLIAGLISHKRLFDKNLRLDSVMQGILDGAKDKKADSILGGIASAMQSAGIELLSMLPVLEEHTAQEGILSQKQPGEAQKQDIEFGFSLAKELSRHDIGQTITVKDKCVVAVEALEGTDACILRSGRMAGPGIAVIKVAKLHQDLRFDLPVIGPRTIKNMKKVKAAAIAIEAEKTCIVDKPEVIRLADKYGISIAVIKP